MDPSFDAEEDDLFDEEMGKEDKDKDGSNQDDRSGGDGDKDKDNVSQSHSQKNFSTPRNKKIVRCLSKLFDGEEALVFNHEYEQLVCLNLLKAMETEEPVVDPAEDRSLLDQHMEETVVLPNEWECTCSEHEKNFEAGWSQSETHIIIQVVEKVVVSNNQSEGDQLAYEGENVQKQKKVDVRKRSQKWGPNILKRKSKRNPQGGVSVLEKAQAFKKKSNLEVTEGNSHVPSFDSSSLISVTSKIGIQTGSLIDHNNCSTSRKLS